MAKITPELYLCKTIVELHVARIKRYKDIHVELHKMDKRGIFFDNPMLQYQLALERGEDNEPR